MQKRLVVIDEQPFVRAGIGALIQRRTDLALVAQSGDMLDALELVARHRPDLVIIDLSFRSGESGCELIRALTSREGGPRVLVLSAHDEDLYGERAISAGAMGYLMKRAPIARLLDAIDRVLQGHTYASAELLERLSDRLSRRGSTRWTTGKPEVPLSSREAEVLELIGRGVGTREIAGRLSLSVKTVETHRAHLKTKLALESAPQLVRFAVQWLEAR